MGKRFIKFKVSKVFNSCRSKHPSSLPSNPVPSSFLLRLPPAATHHNTTTATTKSRHFSLKRHLSSALVSARRSFSAPRPSHDSSPSSSSRFRWEKQPKWHVIAKIPDDFNLTYNYDSTPPRRKIYNSSATDDDVVVLPPPITPPIKHQKRRRIPRRRRRRIAFRNLRNSTSSDSGLFTDDDDGEEVETLVSTDSSTPRHRKRQLGRRSSAAAAAAGDNVLPSPARLSEFMRKMIPCRAEGEVVEGKVRESYAVVKRSEDPYEDFRRSMAEMVVEKQMFDRRELEELLRCFLSLNTEHHHAAIVRAFVDIWDSLFCHPSTA